MINLAPFVSDGQLPLLPLPPRIPDSPERLEAMGTGAAEAAGAGAAGPSVPPTRFEFGPGPLGLGLSDAAGGGVFVSEVHAGGAAECQGMRKGCLFFDLSSNEELVEAWMQSVKPPETMLIQQISGKRDYGTLACKGGA